MEVEHVAGPIDISDGFSFFPMDEEDAEADYCFSLPMITLSRTPRCVFQLPRSRPSR